MSMDANVQALGALQTEMMATANNIANVSTDGFQPSRVRFETGPEGRGVQVSAIQQEAASGPFAPAGAPAAPPSSPMISPPMGSFAISGTDLVREMVSLISVENAYAANAVAINAQDQLSGNIIDLMV